MSLRDLALVTALAGMALSAQFAAASILGAKHRRFRDAVERFRARQTRAVLDSPDPRVAPAAAPPRP